MSPDELAAGVELSVVRGSIRLPRALCEACFPHAGSVALLARDGELLLLPLAPDSVGGLLLKHRNAQGDRVVHAAEFLRAQGIVDDFTEQRLLAQWRPQVGALFLTARTRV
ncbi:hypothetical protein [Sinimarinibacterium flocculans]|uniref:Uncharacterized protein n=1 Tax=Sinimarinibacterium flocculans TaxID=985250 RepID=A0A318E8B7_9GAMM|nr:hypothetical protein [Sinimarinibacterium flocculans]PXV65677.1 hypothetical protein C8D93_10956 [Sinimarinibacterium flocculans]